MLVKLLAWCGAAGISVAPFIIDTPAGKITAICSLACLTVQALNLKAYNLVVMNLTGIGGYLYVLYI